jgi:hypothetical protein
LKLNAIFLSSPTNTFSRNHELELEIYDCERFKFKIQWKLL